MTAVLGDAAEVGPLLFVLVAGIGATLTWRLAAVLVGARLDAAHPVFEWARAVAGAIVAAQAAILVVDPMGAVAGLTLTLRLSAVTAGFLAYHFTGRNVLLGVAVGDAVVLLALVAG
ncbi:AzlD domain-containing protein [Prosthecomicrobium sp. N25]|uniref:AzlD domain-containing protein n=1 Tax=Prosthecomicrobium sp. N25 TaxID=3129254 RepID=UPI003076D090